MKRLIETITSLTVTASPLWNRSPSRSRKVHVSPSGETCQLSAIIGFGCRLASQVNRLS